MTELLSLTPLEYILICFAAVGIFLFFRACWQNIQAGRRPQRAPKQKDTIYNNDKSKPL